MSRKLIVVALVWIALIPFAPPAIAGGWAAVALEAPLEEVVVDQGVTVEYRVLAHARPEAPVAGMTVDFLFLHQETGYFVAATGEATADPEVYAVTFRLMEAGDWEMRSMIRNYAGRPFLQTHSTLVASSGVERAGS